MATTTTADDQAAIRPLRLARDLTQTQLAGLAGCSLAFVGNLERGYIPARSNVLPRILDVLEDAQEHDGRPPQAPAGKEERDAARHHPT